MPRRAKSQDLGKTVLQWEANHREKKQLVTESMLMRKVQEYINLLSSKIDDSDPPPAEYHAEEYNFHMPPTAEDPSAHLADYMQPSSCAGLNYDNFSLMPASATEMSPVFLGEQALCGQTRPTAAAAHLLGLSQHGKGMETNSVVVPFELGAVVITTFYF